MAQILQKKVQLFTNLNICLSFTLVINFPLPNFNLISQNLLRSDGQCQAWSAEGTGEMLQVQGASGFRSAVARCVYSCHTTRQQYLVLFAPAACPGHANPLTTAGAKLQPYHGPPNVATMLWRPCAHNSSTPALRTHPHRQLTCSPEHCFLLAWHRWTSSGHRNPGIFSTYP